MYRTSPNMSPQRLAYLIDICKTSKASPEEIEELNQWYESFESEPDILDDFSTAERALIQDDIWQSLAERKANHAPGPTLSRFLHKKFAITAMLLIAFGAALVFYLQKPIPENRLSKSAVETIVPPGKDQATLTLENGIEIDLNSIAVGEEILENGASIVKSEDGSISYIANATALQGNPVPFNTVSTPAGGQYRISLPDGSMVWLNAASSIRYPAVFDESERVVYLTGEAYFEIKQASRENGARLPFVVATRQQEVEVLGTHFNVKAYEDESSTITTLLEGKVRVVGLGQDDSRQERILKTGESTAWNSSEFRMLPDHPEKAVAWKNGKFIFTGENIKEIMRGLSRWYNVEVAYKGDLRNVNFAGSLSRYDNINKILEKLELTGTVRFEISERQAPHGTERRVVVMP